jgi:glycosyltransferase involved in cell wall biosynthesis
VMDDCSQDGTIEALSNIPQVRIVSHTHNQGMVKNWNDCLNEAAHDWICIVHDDDQIAPDALKTIRKACSLINKPALIGSKTIAPYTDRDFRCCVIEPGLWSVLNTFPLPSGVTIHREIVHALGGFDEQFTYSPDLEYFARVSAQYPIVAIENPQLISFNLHDDNYEYATWVKPDFLTQLEKIELRVGVYAGVEEERALPLFRSRMNSYVAHILRYAPRCSSNKLLLKQFSQSARSKSYLNRRNWLQVQIAAILNWYPRF